MEEQPKDMMVLGAIKKGAKNFDKIRQKTGIEPSELNKILEKLEQRGFIGVKRKKSFLGGEKIEIYLTERGNNEVEQRVHELEQKWNKMEQMYKSGNKEQLQQFMDENKMDFPMMMFFGIMNMMMFSMMFSMIGAQMQNYVPPDQVPPGAENQPSDTSSSGDTGDVGGDGGGYDIDIGF